MNKFCKTHLVFVIMTMILAACSTPKLVISESPREKNLFDSDWKFYRGNVENAELIGFDDSNWRSVDLPHDWSIEDLPGTSSPFDSLAIWGIDGGYLTGGTGWYRKTFNISDDSGSKKVSICFDGVYMNVDVWLNGTHLGNHPYGYTGFEYDITQLLNRDSLNTLAVEVKNEGRNSRWYSGSGIYRHVWLKTTDPVHVKTWGVSITTPEISAEQATTNIQTTIVNESDGIKEIQIVTTIKNQDGKTLTLLEQTHKMQGGQEILAEQTTTIEKPALWSPEQPYLYSVVIEIRDTDGWILDVVTENFGIRSISFSIENGFLLNGVSTKLKGGCMHHDNGPLGAAAYDRAEERRVELMKASGFNAIRCSHNPPSEAFLEACDRLGVLVIDETFDMWRKQKNPQDYHLYFDKWWKRDVDAMVLRDRNHPSVIMWSIGNEIQERGEPEGFATARMLAQYIRKLDSTRPVTSAVNGLWPDKDPYFAELDISGYNYSFGGDHGQKSIFEKDHERIPDRIMYCSESYPLEAFGSWMDVVNHSYVLGDFVWTGFDYLGEASIGWRGYPHDENFFPWNHAFCGDIDICGWKRPQSFYRDVLWNVGNKLSVFVTPPKPSFAVKENRADWSKWHWHDHVAEWNWEGFENVLVEVVVYSGYEKVELLLNGVSLGIKETGITNQFIASWQVPYQSGELKAIGYNGNSAVATSILKTANKPVQIKLTADRAEIEANGQDLCYVTVELPDENGVLHPKSENLINFEISGPGKIVAVASSNPMSVESFQLPERKAWKGRALVIIKSEKQDGEIMLKADAEGLPGAQVIIQSKKL